MDLPQQRLPLYLPHRDYPRPVAKTWLKTAASKFSLENPLDAGQPWLPLTALEGFLVIGHKNPNAVPCDIPLELTIRVRLRPKDYDRVANRCMESLTAFQNDNRPLSQIWREFLAKRACGETASARGDDDSARHARVLDALQFIIEQGLTSRPSAIHQVSQFVKDNPTIAWLLETLGNGQPVFPLDDLQTARLQTGTIPESVVSKFKAICYERDEDGLHILLPAGTPLTAFRTDLYARLDQELPVNVAFTDPIGIRQVVENAAVAAPVSSEAAAPDDGNDTAELDCGEDPDLLKQRMEGIPEARDVLRRAIAEALQTGATDIHIDATDASTATVRMRLNGICRIRGSITTSMMTRVLSVIKIRAKIDSTQTRLPQDGKFRVRAGLREAEVRVSTIPVERGFPTEGCALRILGLSRIPNIEMVGMNANQLAQARWIMQRDNGMFLVTGPTGSGKTTTLNCMVKEIADEGINVVSAEDPVEMQIPWVKHLQVHDAIDLTFARALRSFVRHDPDVIMVGEIRDPETAKMAVSAAQTGHLVFSTLHTNSALMSVGRLIELGVERSLVAGSLSGVAAQRLVRCLCPQCREVSPIDAEQKSYVERYRDRLNRVLEAGRNSTQQVTSRCPDAEEFEQEISGWLEKNETYRPGDCPACNHTGFATQRAVVELYLLGNEPAAIDMIMAARPVSEVQRFFSEIGHLDLAGHSLRSVIKHETTYDEVKRHLPLL